MHKQLYKNNLQAYRTSININVKTNWHLLKNGGLPRMVADI